MFLSPTSDALIAGYDYRGDCRWYCSLNIVFAVHRLANGNILIGTERLVAPPYNTSGLYEMSLIGKSTRNTGFPAPIIMTTQSFPMAISSH